MTALILIIGAFCAFLGAITVRYLLRDGRPLVEYPVPLMFVAVGLFAIYAAVVP